MLINGLITIITILYYCLYRDYLKGWVCCLLLLFWAIDGLLEGSGFIAIVGYKGISS